MECRRGGRNPEGRDGIQNGGMGIQEGCNPERRDKIRREGWNPEEGDGIQKAELQCQSLPAEGLFPPLCSGLGVSVHRDRAAGGAFQMEITAGHGTAQKITSPTYITALCPNIISLLQSTTEDGEVELVFCLCTFFPFG